MFSGFQSRPRRSPARPMTLPVTAVVCLVLMALLAVAQVAHLHANPTDADHCPLCVVMHSAAPSTLSTAVIVLVQVEFAAPVFQPRALIRYWQPKLFTRPPPTSC